MSDNWAIRLSREHIDRAADLRACPTVEAAVAGSVVWLKGNGLDAALQRILAPIADDAVFQLSADGRLTPFGRSVPVERLPELTWQPLTDVLKPVLPVSQMAFFRLPRTGLTLQRSEIEQTQSVLLTRWENFRDWAVAAPEVRLNACRFAVRRPTQNDPNPGQAEFVRVVIMGDPLPPLDGQRFWLAGCVAIPLGFRWFPAVDVATFEATIRRSSTFQGDLRSICIWNPDNDLIDEFPESELIPATRASVRATDLMIA